MTLREDHTLRVFEKRVLRTIFGPKREEDGSWITFLVSTKPYILCCVPFFIRYAFMEN
jgi:hypothetical protein